LDIWQEEESTNKKFLLKIQQINKSTNQQINKSTNALWGE